jgi:hypothetical protein
MSPPRNNICGPNLIPDESVVKKGIRASRKGRPTKYAKRKLDGVTGKTNKSRPVLIATNI